MMSDLTELNKANYDLNNELEELKESIYQTIDNLKTDCCPARFVNEVQKLVPVKPKVVCEVTDKQLEEIKQLCDMEYYTEGLHLEINKILGVYYE